MTRIATARIVSLFVAIAILAVPGFAQDSLPLPTAPHNAHAVAPAEDSGNEERTIILLSAQPLSPADGTTLRPDMSFSWTNALANDYALKVRILETGESFTLEADGHNCNANQCFIMSRHSGVFDRVKDGQTIKWQVVTKIGRIKLKSSAFRTTLDEVGPAAPSVPANGATVTHDQLVAFKWTYTPYVVNGFTIIAKNGDGQTVFMRSVSVSTYGICESYNKLCTLALSPDDKTMTFQKGKSFTWTVTAIGVAGETLKSAKSSFTVSQ